jgi:hypothetical protein
MAEKLALRESATGSPHRGSAESRRRETARPSRASESAPHRPAFAPNGSRHIRHSGGPPNGRRISSTTSKP